MNEREKLIKEDKEKRKNEWRKEKLTNTEINKESTKERVNERRW